MAPEGTVVDWARYRAVLFDLDGVITPTASVHERAWAELFEPWGFTGDDYLTHVDGKPRYDGVRAFLASRGVELPDGEPGDPPGDATVIALGNRKDVLFRELLDRDGVEPFPGTMAVIEVLDRHGIPQAVVSSSRNARPVLAAAGLDERFHPIVDGVTLDEEGLPGKPAPDMFVRAAELLGVAPADAVVVEDTSSGVAAGVAGGFGLVLGVDRGANRDALLAAGAHLVVEDLGETLPAAEEAQR
jgi:beta-phosphoglucomutase family hydrolase